MKANDLSAHLVDPARLAALHAVALLDTPTEESFDRLSRLAAHFLRAPVALVSLVDADRQFFKSCIGLPEPWNSRRGTPLSHSFCQHNRISGQPLLIEDARMHPLFKDNLATLDLKVIAYLGIPLVTADGYVLGSFCVIDSTPRQWTDEDVDVIRSLAHAVMTEIQLRTEIAARQKSEEKRDNLAKWNASLRAEVAARMQAEAALSKSEEELRKSAGHLRTLLQTIPDLIWVKDRDGAYLSCNATFERLFNVREEDILGKTDHALFDREHADSLGESDRMAMTAGKPTTSEEWVSLAGDGRRALVETIRTPMYDARQNLLGLLGIGRDITQRKRSEESLERLQNVLTETEKIGKVGGWEFNIDAEHLVWTEEIFNIHEVDLDYAPTVAKWLNFYSPASRPIVEKCLQRAIDLGESFDVELTLITAKGNSRIVHAIGRVDLDHRRIYGFFQDNTERKRAEKALRINEERLSQAVRLGNIGIFEHDHLADTYYWSAEHLHIYGLTEAPKIHEFLAMIHVDDRERIAAAVRRAHDPAYDGLFDVEFRGLHRDGAIRWISTRSKTFFDGEGDARRPIRTIGAVRDITEERLSHDALEQGKVYAEQLVESANAMIVVLDATGKVQVFNKAAEEITGYSRQEIIGQNWFALLAPQEKYPDLMDMFRNATQSGLPKLFENPILTKGGDERFISWQNTELHDNGTFRGSISYGIDITERKQAEESLRKSATHLRTLVQTIPDLIWLKDQDGIFLSCNKKFEQLLGVMEENMVGKTDYDFVDRELADFFRAHDKKAIEAGKPLSNEEWVTFQEDGHRALLETIKTPMYDDKGALVGVLGIGRDITERKRNEEVLQHYAFLMKEMGKAAKIGGWEFDVATGKGTWTEEVARIHEVDPHEPTNVEIGMSFYAEQSKGKISQAIQDAIESATPYVLELELITAKGNHKWVKTIGHPIIENDKVTKLRGSFQDITERKKADREQEKLQAQLTQAQKMESVGRLAGGVAHDFNNMLGVILGYSELVLEQIEDNQPIYSALKEIQMAAQRSAVLTRQLLAFARKQTVVPKVLDLNTAVEGMLSMLRRLIGEDIHLLWLPGNMSGLIKIDPSQIDQILANLCVNARDAISDNGKVTVETDIVDIDAISQAKDADFRPGKYVLLAVSDNGSGMSEETQRKLFEPFFTTKEMGKGTGLGLASVYGIVKQNKGYINVYSELGLGTTFKIYLPQHETEENHRHNSELLAPAERGNETILLVEDEPAILRMTASMLEQLGYQVLRTNGAAEAIELAREHAGKIKVLITDVVMPEMNGRALAQSILSSNPGLRCLFMSGYTSSVIAHHGVLDQGVLFIQKPFSKQDLAAKIREALAGSRNK